MNDQHLFCNRWKGVIPDVLVLLVMVVFGVNVVQRVRHVTHVDHRHLWQILYERTGLLLDLVILALQALSKLALCSAHCYALRSALCLPFALLSPEAESTHH